MIHHLLTWLRSAYHRFDALLWTWYGDRALPDDSQIRRALAVYEKRERERRRGHAVNEHWLNVVAGVLSIGTIVCVAIACIYLLMLLLWP